MIGKYRLVMHPFYVQTSILLLSTNVKDEYSQAFTINLE